MAANPNPPKTENTPGASSTGHQRPQPEARIEAPYNTPQESKSFNYGDPAAAQRLTLGQALEILTKILPLITSVFSNPNVQAALDEEHAQRQQGQQQPK